MFFEINIAVKKRRLEAHSSFEDAASDEGHIRRVPNRRFCDVMPQFESIWKGRGIGKILIAFWAHHFHAAKVLYVFMILLGIKFRRVPVCLGSRRIENFIFMPINITWQLWNPVAKLCSSSL
jgi:hypothetical protein